MTPDAARQFTTHLQELLGSDPTVLEWPQEFVVADEMPVVFDRHNALLTVYGAQPGHFEASDLRPLLLAGHTDVGLCTRMLVFAPADDAEAWAGLGFVNEGRIAGYWQDGGPAWLWAKASQQRTVSGLASEATATAPGTIPEGTHPPLPRGWFCRPADPADAAEIGNLLREVFPAYPIPEDPGSIRYALASGAVHGRVVRESTGKLAAYASLEFQPGGGAAELTDCATSPAARGKGLMTHLVVRLQEDLADVFEWQHAYSLAREDQPGMQKVLARCGWHQFGRLVNHYRVGGQWVSARLWQS